MSRRTWRERLTTLADSPQGLALASAVLALIALITWPAAAPRVEPATRAIIIDTPSSVPVQPLRAPTGLDPRRVELGRRLFVDVRLSGKNTVSCAGCHNLGAGGADERTLSIGTDGQSGDMNAPTVFNAALNFRQFWDGRAATLEDQIDGPVQNPVEMAATWPQVVARLKQDPEMVQRFRDIYPEGISVTAIKNAIATFERSLITPGAPFDRWLQGESGAISEQAREGWQLFTQLGCVSCHQGVNLGGNLYERFGIMHPRYDEAHPPRSKADFGRFNLTGNPDHRFEFKVPTLRNVALTAPYFHDGSSATLDDAVRRMAWHQLGLTLTDDEVTRLLAFLESLTGVTDAAAL